ncbi:MAG TPA: MraY family glycosyltransferase, partial [Geobacteraceae bacterium]|nr:MraY family glycosyltransferase [Geobacteraceae bacterium]
IPRVGGLAMALGVFAPAIYWCGGDRFVTAYLAGAGVQVAFGLADDCVDLRPRWKLLGQTISALIVIIYGGVKITSLGALLPAYFLLPDWIAIPLTVLAIVGVTNAINLADGLDGLAGGISLLSISCIGYLAYMEGDFNIGLIALALSGAVFGFLRFNTYPATIFMGDAGSQFLGFSSITMALALTQGHTALSPLLPLIILGFPVLDTVTVMTMRIIRGRSPFRADKTHFHHSLLALGLHHTESVLTIYGIQVALIVSALFFRFYSDWLLLIGYGTFSCAMVLIFSLSLRNNWEPKQFTPLVRVKESLSRLRDRTSIIKYLFRPMKLWLLAVLLVTVALTGEISVYVTPAAVAAAVMLALLARYYPQRLGDALRTVLYLLIPEVIYLADVHLAYERDMFPIRLYNLSFAVMALLTILVSKLTRRKNGFMSTPMDFLILFIVVIIPSLPVSNLYDYHVGMIAGKIIICYFALEVQMAELQGKFRQMTMGTLAMLLILAVQGLR